MNKIIIQYLLIIVCFYNVQGCFAQKNKGLKDLDANEFYIMLNEQDDVLLIDARNLKAYKNVAIETAINLENKSSLQAYCDTLDKETPILVYCDVGKRSKQACKFLCEMGFIHVFNLKGGLYKWQANDLPVIETIKKDEENNE